MAPVNLDKEENHDESWCTPFEIRIDPSIDWERPFQLFTVRVEDKAGAVGGEGKGLRLSWPW